MNTQKKVGRDFWLLGVHTRYVAGDPDQATKGTRQDGLLLALGEKDRKKEQEEEKDEPA